MVQAGKLVAIEEALRLVSAQCPYLLPSSRLRRRVPLRLRSASRRPPAHGSVAFRAGSAEEAAARACACTCPAPGRRRSRQR